MAVLHLAWMNESRLEETKTMIAASTTPVLFSEKEVEEAVKAGPNFFSIRHLEQNIVVIAFASKRSVAICSATGHLIRRISVGYDIQKILYVSFARSKDDRKDTGTLHCLAVIGEQDITFFDDTDDHPYTYFVPFKIRNAYKMKYGLLIEQAWINDEEYRMKQDEHIYLHSLTHPLSELLPLLYKGKDYIANWLFCWENEEMSVVDALDDLLLTFDRQTKSHRLYHLRQMSDEELKASLFIFRSTHNRHLSSTPKGPTFSTPKGLEECITSVETRSMMRLARTRTFPLDSPALSNIGSPPVRSNFSCESASIRYTPAGQLSIVSTIGPNMTRFLTRDQNNDLFYAEFCLECIWSEGNKKELVGYSASKAFLSYSLTRQVFVNYHLPEINQLRLIRLADRETKTVVQTSFAILGCLDATYLEKERMTIVMESDHYLTLFAGSTRISAISWPSELLGIKSLHPAVDDVLAVVTPEQDLSLLRIRPLYGDSMVEELFSTCLSAVNTEKASPLIAHWRVFNSHDRAVPKQKEPICDLLHAAFRFILKEIGVTIEEHGFLVAPNSSSETEQPSAKMRRPLQSREELLARIKSFGGPMIDVPIFENRVRVTVDTSTSMFPYFQIIFAAMHSIWQQWALQGDLNKIRGQLVEYLRIGALVMSHEHLLRLYELEFPTLIESSFSMTIKNNEELKFAKNPYLDGAFNIYATLGAILRYSQESTRYNNQVFTFSPKIAQFILAVSVGLNNVTNQIDLLRLLGKRWKKLMPFGLENEVHRIILSKKVSGEQKCAKLLSLFDFKGGRAEKLPCTLGLLLGKLLLFNQSAEDMYPQLQPAHFEFPTEQTNAEIAASRWPTDKRMENIYEMLRSDRPVLINTTTLKNIPSHLTDEREIQEVFLHGTCIRYLAQAFGRAMHDFRTRGDFPQNSDGNVVPELCLQARIFPANNSFEIPITDATRPYREWGEFYNGVACALRLGHASLVKLDSEYIVSLCVNQDKMSNQTAAGMLYGFALNGHVLSSTYHISEMLITMDEFQSVAILIGYGVAKLGTGDMKTYKMISTQLPFLFGQTTLNINIPAINQTAALASLGMLFAQTSNFTLVNKIINEIGKTLSADEAPANDRYAYRLNAGFAVGLITLGQGNEYLARQPPFAEEQTSIVERLIHMLLGHPRKLCIFQSQIVQSTETFSSNPIQQPPSCHVREKESVNTHLAGQAACIALGLMFFRTNNESIAKRIALPNSIVQLEGIKPDLIMARLLCYHLIMWDSIQPDLDYVQNMVPSSVESYLLTRLRLSEMPDEELKRHLMNEDRCEDLVDFESLAQIYCYVIAGTAMAIGMRFKNAPPDQKNIAYLTLAFYVKSFLPTNKQERVQEILEASGSNVVSLVTNTLLQSLAMLMTNSGDMEVIRAARVWRVHEPVIGWMRSTRKHQEQVAAHEALGMLSMGGGRFGFKEDNLSNALLLISFFPQACHGINDNRFYHQPLRFLWTQTVEQRLIVPFNNWKNPIQADIRATYLDGAVGTFKAPTVIPPLELLSHLEFGGKGLETLKYDLSEEMQKQELIKVLTKGHGRLRINECKNDHEALKEDYFDLELTASTFQCKHPKIQLQSHEKSRLHWPCLESISGMRKHLTSLSQSLKAAEKEDRVMPEVYFAETLANWAGEERLAFAIELAIDRISYQ